MSRTIGDKWGKGLTPQQYIDGMTKNRDKLQDWYDKFVWDGGELEAYFDSLNNRDDLRCLIIAADWCGDCNRNVPVVLRAMEKAGIPVKLLIMEEHPDLMDQHLTLGGRSIPVVLIVDTGGVVLGKWGARPNYVQEPMTAFKQGNPDREAPDYKEKQLEAYRELGHRYGEGTEYQTWIVEELQEILSGV